MNKHRPLWHAAVVAALACPATAALAQAASTFRLHCYTVGSSPQEALGDREGHAISMGEFVCRTEGGPLDGALATGQNIWEWNGTNATALGGISLTRGPRGMSAYQAIEGKLALVLADGKPAGFTGSGHGKIMLATGAAAATNGKILSWSLKSTAPGQFVVDARYD